MCLLLHVFKKENKLGKRTDEWRESPLTNKVFMINKEKLVHYTLKIIRDLCNVLHLYMG